MQRKRPFLFIALAGAFLFNLLFWREELALNALLFDAFLISMLFYCYPSALKNRIVLSLLPAHLLCLSMVLLQHTVLSQVALVATLLLLAAFAEYAHRSAWFAGSAILSNFILFVAGLSQQLRARASRKRKPLGLGKIIRFSIFPVLIGLAFFIIYQLGNSIFAGIMARMGRQIELFLENLSVYFSFSWIMLLVAGFYLTGALLLRTPGRSLEQKEAGKTDGLQRTRRSRRKGEDSFVKGLAQTVMGRLATGILALKHEHTVGLISLGLLNALLLFINVIDIHYLWLNFSYTPDMNLTQMIHEGTEILILSLVLAMIVLLFFFRGNLNFYKRNKWLKAGAYAWLLQNAVLVVSVLIRDYYYIKLTGLAYKRIGVLFFLLMVLTGLVTVFIKIVFKKTTYYLLRVNAWAGIFLLAVATTVDWDMTIAKYNIAHSDKVALDIPFLLSLSDRTLPLLEENMPLLKKREAEINKKGEYMYRCLDCVENVVRMRHDNYVARRRALSWRSWNLADAA
ncbi:MAG: DUF4173 domain-containing protein, partial [Bacteroidetes bacterium]|nr:DUF4173 domain-containing protein [Bacteroidota bacterium]